ncbi:MAG: hypothetical protein U0703_14090 [Anaerolineae bacterium]
MVGAIVDVGGMVEVGATVEDGCAAGISSVAVGYCPTGNTDGATAATLTSSMRQTSAA